MEKDLKPKSRALGIPNEVLPKKGRRREDILKTMTEYSTPENVNWREGKISGAVYHGDEVHQDFLNQVFGLYSLTNPLHADMWPSAMKYEAEIVAMTASLVNGGDKNVCGCTSSGGTESIILAIKAHRDYYAQEFGVTEPELIACVSAHAAVDKACDMMKIKLIKVAMTKSFQIDLTLVERAIGPNTIMIYSSAPSYAQGVIDPIRSLGELAVRYRIGLHVDCCLGGFVLPFAKTLGFPVKSFDFSIKGVSSMSLDTHKYGYALKGASVVLYRSGKLRQAQYFCYADWSGGMYTTPGVAGSRSGGLIAQCWASMMALGEEGYLKHVDDIMRTTQAIARGVRDIPCIELLGEAEAMIVCFGGRDGLNIYAVADLMSKRYHWSLGTHQSPACVHMCCTVRQVGHEAAFLANLRECVAEVKNNPDIAPHSGSAGIYGATAALPPGPVNELLKVYNDVVLKL